MYVRAYSLETGKPLPAIVLVAGSGPSDRDETVAGIPIFGQLAGALADAGFLAVRYDKRGVGQSGGRPESATLADYAEDLRAVVRFTSDRKDVDRRRVAIVGHGEGGMLGLLTAAAASSAEPPVKKVRRSMATPGFSVLQRSHRPGPRGCVPAFHPSIDPRLSQVRDRLGQARTREGLRDSR